MKKLILSFAVGLMFCIGAFAIPITNIPADESASVNVASPATAIVTSIDRQPINDFEVTQGVATEEVAASPTDIATAAIANPTTNRTATVSRTNQLRAATNTSPPSDYNGKLVGQAFDAENEYVPLGSPKPVEATARSGSYA